MGTFMSITAYGENAEEAAEAAFGYIEEIHNAVLRVYAEETTAGDEDFDALLRLSEFAHEQTGGAFNHRMRPLIELWGIGAEHERVPSQQEIDAALAQYGYDFGAIAKGYAAGIAAQAMLHEYGIESALIELGGDIVALGGKPDGSPWRIGLRSPLGDGAVIGTLEVTGMSIMTSGSYERYFEQNGIRYHHIFDPATGCPADSGLLSVTVISSDPVSADAFSTALFVMGLERGVEFVRLADGMSAIFITDEREIHLVGEAAQGFKITDNRFRITP
jgi:thiamine biosynthesis lipoprotein